MIKNILSLSINDCMRAIQSLTETPSMEFIEDTAALIAQAFRNGNKVIIAGNGGSLCDAMHFAEELTGQFRKKRKALPAIALSEPGHITCCANDFGFEHIFSRGVEAYGCNGDVFIGLTTSGNSLNIINAVNAAKKLQMHTVAFLGRGGGILKGQCDLELVINGFDHSDRVQEVHMAAIHIIIELIEYHLFPESFITTDYATCHAS